MDQEKIQQLQMLEQSMTQLLMQKQQFQMQLMEVESALKEIQTSEKNYKIVGNIMVSASKDELKKELDEKKEMLDLRINSIEKQEKDQKEKAEELQKEVMSDSK